MTSFFSRWFDKKDKKDDAPVRDVAALAAPLAAPALHIVKTDAPSRSHFGGAPNLPPGLAWPERGGRKLEFLARLCLSEIHDVHAIEWLPDAGALLFFYDMEQQPWGFDPKDRGGWAVLLAPDLPAPISPTPTSERRASSLLHRNVAFRRIDVLPSYERDAVAALGLSEAESDVYPDLATDRYEGEPHHQISGFPAPVQGDAMELECQLVSVGVYCGDESGFNDPRALALASGAANWRLLLQLDSDDELEGMWGDAGTIYYWVEADAARQGRFDNVWLILQCY